MTGDEENSADRINNERAVTSDMEKIMRYVKDDLFFRVIDVFSDEQFMADSYLHKDFMARARKVLPGAVIGDPITSDGTAYMKFLWTRLVSKKSYKDWLSMKRSNAYQAVQDRFFRKYIMCGKYVFVLMHETGMPPANSRSNSKH